MATFIVFVIFAIFVAIMQVHYRVNKSYVYIHDIYVTIYKLCSITCGSPAINVCYTCYMSLMSHTTLYLL